MMSLALDGRPEMQSPAALLPIRQQRSESTETPRLTSPRSPKTEESMPNLLDAGQLVLAVERARTPRSLPCSVTCERIKTGRSSGMKVGLGALRRQAER